MIIKVCGIKTKENISFLSKSKIDMVGLNFYRPSSRYIDDDIEINIFDKLGDHIKRVGVFVNEKASAIFEISQRFKLDYVQLHGDEDANFCSKVAEQIPIIKVFRIDETFHFESSLADYSMATYFLFDTQTKNYGGSGKKFDWEKLKQYSGDIPFLLSGGIGPDDASQILDIDHPKFIGIDINSKFESQPGIKDRNLVLPFVSLLRSSD